MNAWLSSWESYEDAYLREHEELLDWYVWEPITVDNVEGDL